MTDRIIWESAADLNTRLRVVRLADAGEGHEALLVERGEKDSQGVRAWLETDDPDDRAEATCLALCKLDDTLQAKGPDPKREALSPEVKAPGFYPLRPELEIASLRAEFAALGKHVEDVERRAYASPTNDALTVELGHNVNAPSWQIITTGERLDSLDRRTSDNTDALALWQGAVDRLAAKVDALERAHLARATSHDLTGDAVTRLVSKVDELDGFCSGLRSRCGAIEQEARQHMRHATELADVQTAALAALGDRVAELNDASDKMHARLVSLADRVRGLDPSLPDAPKSAATDGPLDLATLRVPCAKEPLDWARIADGQLQLGPDEDGDPCEPRITLTPPSARLLARALTQWANDQEGKGS